ncbi:MAG: exodeoxyribonuclease VII small subunit [Lachnospiraceae bacterium]|nr:exodeoxyribonuclease VII small subunit [Lachnospiraceae bacterium]
MAKKEESFNLEEAFLKLEETVATLERDDISLEASFQEYQKGMELLKKCSETIDKVEKKVLILNENGETDEF